MSYISGKAGGVVFPFEEVVGQVVGYALDSVGADVKTVSHGVEHCVKVVEGVFSEVDPWV